MSESPVTTEIIGSVAVITMDDGKANAFTHTSIDGINVGLDRADAEAGAVLITGRPGRFSAGFDLAVMTAEPAERIALVKAGGELFMRIYGFGLPVVAACNGHALAAGSILLMAADTRFGAAVDGAKIGMNEVNIGMILPEFATELAKERLSKRHVAQATAHGRVYSPAEAVDVGYLDHLVEPEALYGTALHHAQELADYCRRGALAGTKQMMRGDVIAKVLAGMEGDLSSFDVAPA